MFFVHKTASFNIQTEKANTQQSYVFKPLNYARIKSGKVENIPTPLDKFYGDSVETNGDVGDKKKREAQRKEGGSCLTERGWGFSSSSKGSLLPETLGCLILYVFHPQNKPSPY